ncbi:DSD1 family PLP-dependent enzyme [Nevskia soli]|uniref:DSD1 family PLP-dependent enzyme n=1 Tax=Nevskia soli TaxID=418856 RepID=UPI0004A711E5|nr:DSD1 family PLP-dependent enzyme [Nevskia soli]
MNRRNFMLGAAGVGAVVVGGGLLARPSANGKPYDEYFRVLNEELKKNGPMRPCLVIDLDRLDHNIDQVVQSVKLPKHYRIVEKSLPSQGLIDYVSKRAGTRRLMSFHQPFINDDVVAFPDADILIGKPLPVRSAEVFYKNLKGSFDPSRQLQWLNDTPEHVQQYLELAKGLGAKLRINIELDVGLHRGGVAGNEVLGQMLSLIAANPANLEFAGFMGYDPHAGMAVPRILGSHEELFRKGMAIYQERADFTRNQYARLWREDLTLNAAGSPTYKMHEAETLSNDISVGTALLKPTHYDLDTLTAHVPAAYIATPVLKSVGPVELPALDGKSRIFSWWDPNQLQTYFIYGGYWMAEYESPKGLQFNSTFGHSTNQEIVNASPGVGLKVDDQVFFRPTQSEFVLLQFGDLVAVRGGKIVDYWAPMQG